MSLVNVKNVHIKNKQDLFIKPIELDLNLICFKNLEHDLIFRVIYVGSADNHNSDQVLEEITIINLDKGEHLFEINVNPPDPYKIPTKEDLLGSTILIMTFLYRNQEYFRISYFVFNNYLTEFQENKDSSSVMIDKVQRNILIDKPRLREFNIIWDNTTDNSNSNNEEEPKKKEKEKQKKKKIVKNKSKNKKNKKN